MRYGVEVWEPPIHTIVPLYYTYCQGTFENHLIKYHVMGSRQTLLTLLLAVWLKLTAELQPCRFTLKLTSKSKPG